MKRRIVLFFVAPLLGLIILLGALSTWLATTDSGLRWAWQMAGGFLPGLHAKSIEGRLTGPLTLRGLRFESEAFRLLIDTVEFDWLPSTLSQREVVIEQLRLSGVRYTQLQAAPPADKSEPFALPDKIALPVSIALREVTLDGFEYRALPNADPFSIETAGLKAGFAASKLDIIKLHAAGPLFEIDGQATVATAGAYASDVKLGWQARPPGYAPLRGKTVLQGDLMDMQLSQAINTPYNLALDAKLYDIVDELQFKASLAVSDAELSAISATLPAVSINAAAEASGALANLGLSAELSAVTSDHGTINVSLDGGLSQQRVNLQKLLVSVAGTPATLQAQGQVDLNQTQPGIDIDVNWQQLQWPLQSVAPNLASESGTLKLTGTTQDYRVQADAELRLPEDSSAQLKLAGNGSDQQLNLHTIQLDALQGQIEGEADVAWQPNLIAKLKLQGKNLNPATISADWPGKLRLELAASAGQRGEKTVARLQRLELNGDLRDQPVALRMLGALRDEILHISRFTLRSGPSNISAEGELGETLALDWHIDSPDLATLLPQASGTLKGQGKLGGSLPKPTFSTDLQGRNIRFDEYSIDELSLLGDVDLQRTTPSTLKLVTTGAAIAGLEFENIVLSGSGNGERHQISLRVLSSKGNADLKLSGKLQDDVWSVDLTEASLNYAELAPWTLTATQAAEISAETQSLLPGCWQSGDAKLCLQGERAADSLQASVNLNALPFTYFEKLMPTDIAVQGRLNGTAEISQQAGTDLKADIDMGTTASELRKRGTEQQSGDTLLALQPASVKARLNANGLSALLDLPFVDQGGVHGKLNIPPGDAKLGQRSLNGDIKLDIQDIGFIAALTPEIEKAGGVLAGAVQLTGTLEKPLPRGQLELSEGLLMLAAPGLEVTGLELQATAKSDGSVAYTAGANSGDGTIRLSGSGDLSGETIDAAMAVTGDEFQFLNTESARVYASPDLQIALNGERVTVNGEVRIPRAEITPQQLPESAVAVSKDQVIIMEESADPSAAAQREVYARLSLILGDAVTVDGFGFKGGVTGALDVTQKPDEPTIGSGELEITDGEYRAYGQGLVIEQGRILFAGGPIDKPGISVRAVRRPAEGISVGVRARGSLQQPDFTVFSEPAMSQSEQLSWLVLGRPLENASDAEGDMVTKAAMTLGVKGGNYLTKKLGEDLGVDNIGIETGSGEAGAASDVNQAAFVIGKYLSPKLYVSYGIGLFESISKVKLEYTINEHWKVSTESSTLSSGGDVTYTIER